jgi:hypothetical protein
MAGAEERGCRGKVRWTLAFFGFIQISLRKNIRVNLMGYYLFFLSLFCIGKREKAPSEDQDRDRGILVFENTSEVIRAENVLKAEGWDVKVKGPPPEIRTGCDLVIEFPLIEELNVRRVLEKAGVPPLKVVPVKSALLEPVNLFQTKDFGDYLMIRAANMKLTLKKRP